MRQGSRLISTGLTHAAALLVGWGTWTAIQHSRAPASAVTEAKTRVRESRGGDAKSLDEIFEGISPKFKESSEKSPIDWKARHAKYLAEFEELVKSMPVPDDLAGAVEAEMKSWSKGDHEPSAKMAALMYQWACKDFAGLLKWAGESYENPNFQAFSYHNDTILQKLMDEKGLDSVVGALNDPHWSNQILYTTSAMMGKSPDLSHIADFKEKLNPGQWRDFKRYLSDNWAWTEKSKLVELAVSENQPDIISRLARSQSRKEADASGWLLGLMKDETLDAGFREKLAKDNNLKNLALSNSKLPMADRIALLQAGDPNVKPDQSLLDQLATNDTKSHLNDDRDWSYEFRHGSVDADEVLATISTKLPDESAKSPDAIRNTVFQDLIEEDSSRAAELLKNMPPKAQAKAVMDAAQNAFFRVDPNQFLTALQLVPADDPEQWDARLSAWIKHGPDNYRRLDADYVSWVRALPDGTDRDMALYSLAIASERNNSSLSAQLRGEVKNEKLKRKMSNTQ
ncbi:MAG: hypothetical protein ABI073_15265 [Luteolibacter sp.]